MSESVDADMVKRPEYKRLLDWEDEEQTNRYGFADMAQNSIGSLCRILGINYRKRRELQGEKP